MLPIFHRTSGPFAASRIAFFRSDRTREGGGSFPCARACTQVGDEGAVDKQPQFKVETKKRVVRLGAGWGDVQHGPGLVVECWDHEHGRGEDFGAGSMQYVAWGGTRCRGTDTKTDIVVLACNTS